MNTVLESLKKIDKKLWYFLGGLAIFVILTIVGTKIIYNVNNYSLTYTQLEAKLLTAAKSYYAANKNMLPKLEGDTAVINSTDLVNNKYLKPLDSLIKTDHNCSGRVVVKKNNNNYNYTTYLNCANYSTIELYKKVTKNVVTSGNGLYNINNEYIFRGENLDNYVKFGGKLWQIVKLDANNNITLIYSDVKADYLNNVWDDRYNIEYNSNSGINNFPVSRAKETLNNLYHSNKILATEAKSKLLASDLCVGKRNDDETANNNSIECSQKDSNYYGLITISDFLTATLDTNCKKPLDGACENYNYLVTGYDWWTATGNKDNSCRVYYIESNGSVNYSDGINDKYYRITIRLSSDTMVSGGTGSLKHPYKIN